MQDINKQLKHVKNQNLFYRYFLCTDETVTILYNNKTKIKIWKTLKQISFRSIKHVDIAGFF